MAQEIKLQIPKKVQEILGTEVEDVISSFQGTAFGIAFYLNGCVRICVAPKMIKKDNIPDGSIPDDVWFDQDQIKIINDESILVREGLKVKPTNGPIRCEPTRQKVR